MKKDDVDVLYSDVKFTRNKKKPKETALSEVDPSTSTYSEVKIRNPQRNPEPSAVSQHEKPLPQRPGSKVRAALVIVVFLLVAAGAALGVMTCEYMKTKEMLRSEKVKWEADRANFTDRLSKMKSCPTARPPACPTTSKENQEKCCDKGWEQNEGSCYYFSEDYFSWEESKQKCMNQDGSLVKIDNKEEQKFLAEKLKKKMNEPEDKFWIGLTDSAIEEQWLWVDGSNWTDPRFWAEGEPDDWKGTDNREPEGEDCVRMGEKDNPILNSWFDKSCKVPHRRICEKEARIGKSECVCMSETHGNV